MRDLFKVLVILGFVFFLIFTLVPMGVTQKELIKGGQYNLSDYQKITGAKIVKFNEAPQLTELVKQGKLPPVEERLPDDPLVVVPFEEIGQYGGVIKQTHIGMGAASVWDCTLHEPLVYFDSSLKTIYPNLAKSWKISDGGKIFTFYLRKGIKWSDGEPFTADDIMFWYEDILLNKDLTPVFPGWLTIKNNPVVIEKVDNYTVRFRFSDSYGYFLDRIAMGNETFAPKHYLKQFHPRYTSKEKLDELSKKEGFSYWYQLFAQKASWASNPEVPVIWAWKSVTPLSEQYHISERNPYYWKIDPQGNQLPYIDRWRRELVSGIDMIIMKAVTGEIDFQFRHIWNAYDYYTLLMENRGKGNYQVVRYPGTDTGAGAIYLNLNVKDPVLRSLFQNRTFRRALSIGINRKDINALILLGLGEPRQGLGTPTHPAYVEKYDKAYTEYNPEKANLLLDSIGLKKRDKDGYRLRPDGKPLAITIDAASGYEISMRIIELVAKYWRDLGIKTEPRLLERSLYFTRINANEFEAVTWSLNGGLTPIDGSWVPSNMWCPLWSTWLRTGGKSGEEPPKEIKKLWEMLQVEAVATTSVSKRNAIIREVFRLYADNLWIIGTVGIPWMMGVINNNLKNIPKTGVLGSPYNDGIFRPEQFFFKK